jgi:hypothetical protein
LLESILGDPGRAVAEGAEAVNLCRRTESPLWVAVSRVNLAWAHIAAGNPAEAGELAEPTLAEIREAGTGLHLEAGLLAGIARSKLATGDEQGALAAAEEGVAIMDDRRLTTTALRAPLALARVLVETEGPAASERIEDVVERAMKIVRESGATAFEPLLRAELSAVTRLRGQ